MVKIKEMIIGTRECFNYIECSNCGNLQIMNKPENMGSYYPKNYYSFENPIPSSFKEFFLKRRDKYALYQKNIIGKIIYKKYPFDFLKIMGTLGMEYNLKILDVGCGSGFLLRSLQRLGFNHLQGVDPFITKDIIEDGIQIFKKDIHGLPNGEKFDFIILNHSFEHMDKQSEVLVKISDILSENGVCVIAMPVKNGYIWNLYGADWVQIDAPRHLSIHTLKSFNILLNKSSLVLKEIIFNSDEFQFWGSEQNQQNIELMAENSYLINPNKSIFTRKDIKTFKERSNELNDKELGDQAVFVLKKP